MKKAIEVLKDITPYSGAQRCGMKLNGDARHRCGLAKDHTGEHRETFLVPIPRTADEFRAAGWVFVGRGERS